MALRERLAFEAEALGAAIERLCDRPGVEEAYVLSTCNRVEVLARVDRSAEQGVEELKAFLCDERDVERAELERHLYQYSSNEAVTHLFEVATGLDSMILGEPQILGQVKQAYAVAKTAGTTGTVLERLLQQCLGAAKRVRNGTGISRHAVSVASAAVNLARQIFGELTGRKVLLIGAGKMSELVARHLSSQGVGEIVVTSRTYNRAVLAAARVDGEALSWDDAFSKLGEVDIVVSCTGASRPILERKQVQATRKTRRGRPLFLIDIAVPRDIEPEVNQLDNVYLYDIDGLQDVVDANLNERRQAAERARAEIAREVEAFDRWRQALEITPTIVTLRSTLLGVGRRELERFRHRIGPLTAEQERAIEGLTRAVIQKILHQPVVHLKKSVDRGDVAASTSIYRKIFGLDEAVGHDDAAGTGAETERSEPSAGPRRLLKGGKED